MFPPLINKCLVYKDKRVKNLVWLFILLNTVCSKPAYISCVVSKARLKVNNTEHASNLMLHNSKAGPSNFIISYLM